MWVAVAAAACSGDNARPELGTAAQPSGAAPLRTAPAIEVSILYGSEKKSWLEAQVAAFNASQPTTKAGARITVRSKPLGSGEAMTAIVDGSERPTVFSPASNVYLALLNQRWQSRDNHTQPLAPAGEPVVLSPLVIAMWKPMAEALGWPNKPLGWTDILKVGKSAAGWGGFGRPEWGELKLGHTHPEYSNSGLLSVLAIAYAGSHKTRGLTASELAKAERFIGEVEDSIVHYGKSTGFFTDKMIEHGPSYLSAAVTYENLVIESYNKNPPLPLVAIYPLEGTFWSDHPYSVLDAPWVTAAHREAAAVFLAFLKQRPQQQAAMALGFRPVDQAIAIGAPIDGAHGVDAKQPQTLLETPDAATLDALLATWRKAKKAADVVLVFDKSGSMAGQPLAQAKAAAKAFVATLDPRDRVTLIFFDHVLYPPFGPVEVGKAKQELEARIDGVSASGDTAFYSATKRALELLARPGPGKHRIRAAIVMTDGNDNRSKVTLAQLSTALAGEQRSATVFTIAYGSAANHDAMRELARLGGGSFSQGDVNSIVDIYRDLAAFF